MFVSRRLQSEQPQMQLSISEPVVSLTKGFLRAMSNFKEMLVS
jgi:hypothetical protein